MTQDSKFNDKYKLRPLFVEGFNNVSINIENENALKVNFYWIYNCVL